MRIEQKYQKIISTNQSYDKRNREKDSEANCPNPKTNK